MKISWCFAIKNGKKKKEKKKVIDFEFLLRFFKRKLFFPEISNENEDRFNLINRAQIHERNLMIKNNVRSMIS